jgi:signal transduction histidine kinase
LDTLYDRLPDERRKKLIRDIRKHAQVLDELIGDVLEISRIEDGQISVERQDIPLLDLVRNEAHEQSPLAQERSLTLCVSGTEQLIVRGNDEQLRRVVRNVLNNAIKYTPPHGQITCECQELPGEAPESAWPGIKDLAPGRWAALRVVDTGVGIGHEELPHIFDRFYRVKEQGKTPGTGLGLSIAKELIEAHGGHIAAASTPDKGSVFAIYLPLLEE